MQEIVQLKLDATGIPQFIGVIQELRVYPFIISYASRNSGNTFLKAMAVTCSEGHKSILGVRIHEPKEFQTSLGKDKERHWSPRTVSPAMHTASHRNVRKRAQAGRSCSTSCHQYSHSFIEPPFIVRYLIL